MSVSEKIRLPKSPLSRGMMNTGERKKGLNIHISMYINGMSTNVCKYIYRYMYLYEIYTNLRRSHLSNSKYKRTHNSFILYKYIYLSIYLFESLCSRTDNSPILNSKRRRGSLAQLGEMLQNLGASSRERREGYRYSF